MKQVYKSFGHFSSKASMPVAASGFRALRVAGVVRALLCMLLLCGGLSARAQGVTVQGKVIDDADNQPIMGAVVAADGGKQGTVTDAEGQFTLTVSAADAALKVSYVGYQTQVLSASSAQIVRLKTDIRLLGDVVCTVPYGELSKRNITGSIGRIDEQQIKSVPVASLEQAMQGKISGVQVTNASGMPGGAVIVNIRGTSSISSGNEPLYVVDGMPLIAADLSQKSDYQGNLLSGIADINPADIASIEVLKDASAAALYGSRASNGVVLITTKKGREGKTRISLDSYVGVQDLWHKLDVLNADEQIAARNEAIDNYNTSLGLVSTDGAFKRHVSAANAGANTNWIDEITRAALQTNHQLSLSGGSEKTQFFTSLGYFLQQGIMKNTDYKRYNLRSNITHRLSKRLSFTVDMALSAGTNNRPAGEGNTWSPWINALSASPDYAVYRPDGTYNLVNQSRNNPVALVAQQDQQTNKYRGMITLKAAWNILPELRYDLNMGGDYIFMHERSAFPIRTLRGNKNNGEVQDYRGLNFSNLIEHTLTFDKTWAQLRFKALAGYSYQNTKLDNNYIIGVNFVAPALKYIDSAGSISEGSSSLSQYALQSFFGRFNLNYADRYLLEASLRSDASSKFAPKKRVGYFPAASLGWRLSKEAFFPQNDYVSDLKLRAAIGYTGNQEGIANYLFYDIYRASGVAYQKQAGLAFPTRKPNKDLTWEKTLQYDLGLDAYLLNGIVELTFDWYLKNTKDLLLTHTVNSLSGYNTQTSNVGSVRNSGFEFMVAAHPLRGALRWDTRLTLGYQKNKVTALVKNERGEEPPIIEGHNNYIKVGDALATFYLIKAEGIYQSKEEILAQPHGQRLWDKGIRPGDVKYYDKDGNGILNDADRVNAGSPYPTLTGSFINTFTYKRFDFNLDLQYSLGGKLYAGWKENYTGLGNQGGHANGYAILREEWKNRWSATNTAGTTPRAVASGAAYDNNMLRGTTRFIENNDFLRIRNITFGYTLPEQLTRKCSISHLRFYVQINNLYTFTKYDGFDPEVAMNPNRSTYRGYDPGSMPLTRSFILGMNVTF